MHTHNTLQSRSQITHSTLFLSRGRVRLTLLLGAMFVHTLNAALSYPGATQDDPAHVRVLFLYTQTAKTVAGHVDIIRQHLAQSLFWLEEHLAASEVHVTLENVLGAPTLLLDSDLEDADLTMAAIVSELRLAFDPWHTGAREDQLANMVAARHTLEADVVLLVTGTPDSTIGVECAGRVADYYLGETCTSATCLYSHAVGVINIRRLCSHSLAVILGRVLGAGPALISDRIVPYGAPYSIPYNGTTLMWSPHNTCVGHVPVYLYSNPRLLYNGWPAGEVGNYDNSRALNTVSPYIAHLWEDHPHVPHPPFNVSATYNASDNEVTLTWTVAITANDRWPTEDVLIEVSANGEPWSLSAVMPASPSEYTTTVDAGAEYCYRVQARNSVGSTDWTYAGCIQSHPKPGGSVWLVPPFELFATDEDVSLRIENDTNAVAAVEALLYQGPIGDPTTSLLRQVFQLTETQPSAVWQVPTENSGRIDYWVRLQVAGFSWGSDLGPVSLDIVENSETPGILEQTSDLVTAAGMNVTVGVSATGSRPLSYQWYRGAVSGKQNPVPGATSSTLTLDEVWESCLVWVRVTTAAGTTAESAAIRVIVPRNTVGPKQLCNATGHYYAVLERSAPISWEQALVLAESVAYEGVPGHLATITSEQESDFLAGLVKKDGQLLQYAVGAYSRDNAWRWHSGETWSYAPEDIEAPLPEHTLAVTLLCARLQPQLRAVPLTGDVTRGYIIEWDMPFNLGSSSYWVRPSDDVLVPSGDCQVAWTTADTFASSMSYLGQQGHLATLGTANEHDSVVGALLSNQWYLSRIWLGATQADAGPEPDGGWSWVTPDPWTDTRWAPSEPDNSGDEPLNNQEPESFLGLYLGDSGDSREGIWNDLAAVSCPSSFWVHASEVYLQGSRSYLSLTSLRPGQLVGRRYVLQTEWTGWNPTDTRDNEEAWVRDVFFAENPERCDELHNIGRECDLEGWLYIHDYRYTGVITKNGILYAVWEQESGEPRWRYAIPVQHWWYECYNAYSYYYAWEDILEGFADYKTEWQATRGDIYDERNVYTYALRTYEDAAHTYYVCQVTLLEDGFLNLTTGVFREYFVWKDDYTMPTGLWEELTDTEREDVLLALGYRHAYKCVLSGLTEHGIDAAGTSYELAYDPCRENGFTCPPWFGRQDESVVGLVGDWAGLLVMMPEGLNQDIESVERLAGPTSVAAVDRYGNPVYDGTGARRQGEWVGETWHRARVQLTQDKSAVVDDPPNVDDYDDSPARWSVAYIVGTERQCYAVKDGRTGQHSVETEPEPGWWSEVYLEGYDSPDAAIHTWLVEFPSASGWISGQGETVGLAAGDEAGYAIAVSADGSRLAVGAPFHDVLASEARSQRDLEDATTVVDAGHVRVYRQGGGSLVQVGQDIPGEAGGDQSGQSVALSADGTTVAIGAPFSDGNGEDAGQVRVYEYDGSVWIPLGDAMNGQAEGDQFGVSVALSRDGRRVAVGAPGNDGSGSDAGQVRVFSYDGAVWVQVGQALDGEAEGDDWGRSVALSSSGSRLAVGAPLHDGTATDAGHVRVLEYMDGLWRQAGSDIGGEAAGDQCGWSVALSADGQRVAVGAPLNDSTGDDAGQVQVFGYQIATWVQLGSDIEGSEAGDHSGWSVALSADGARLAVGAPLNDGAGGDAGQVRVYAYDGIVWGQLGADILGAAPNDQSGRSVALTANGAQVSVGSPLSSEGAPNAGRVQVQEFALEVQNRPPVAAAGPDRTIVADHLGNASVALNGSDSWDPDGDALTYVWQDGSAVIAGPTSESVVSVNLGVGNHYLALIVSDEEAETDTTMVIIEVVPPPTAVGVVSFTALRGGGGQMMFRWHTEVEYDLLGFHVERQALDGSWLTVDSGLIPSLGTGRPGDYGVAVAGGVGSAGTKYRLIGVNLRGEERVVASTMLHELLLTPRLGEGTGDLQIEIHGIAGERVILETAGALVGKQWSAVQRIVLDTAGTGNVSLRVGSDSLPQFYRVRIE